MPTRDVLRSLSVSRSAWACVLVAGCGDVAVAREPVVYGTDDRMEVYEHTGAVHRAIAESAVAMQLGAEWIDASDPTDVRITYEQTLGEAHSLCADVRYQEQIEPGTCSGTLIDERHVLTAGHCVSAGEDCDGASWPWVFGFHYEAAGRLRTLTTDDVYRCVRTVVLRDDATADYAVIELDRAVVGHTPAHVRRSAAPVDTPVTMIGHPNGIPMKIAGNAMIRSIGGIEIQADVDAFFGNSGSGVFDDAGEAIGILVAGAPVDFHRRPGAGCSEVVVLDPLPATQEILTAVAAPIDDYCAQPGVVSPVCESGGVDASAPREAGAPDVDTGAPREDAGAASADAGTIDLGGTPAPAGGCGCRASSPASLPAASWALAALVLFAGRRRSRARGSAVEHRRYRTETTKAPAPVRGGRGPRLVREGTRSKLRGSCSRGPSSRGSTTTRRTSRARCGSRRSTRAPRRRT